MPMSSVYGPADEAESVSTLELALDLGVTFWDTAEIYGDGGNESLIGPVLERNRDAIVLATKFGFDPGGVVAGRPENARRAIDGSLTRLRTDVIDLWYLHRVDPSVPIEETVGVMGEMVAAGKVRHLGLSEASAESLRRAHATHPISALQSEWSLWTRDLEPEVLPVARELGIGIVPYSPLGRGMLTATLNDMSELTEDDYRRSGPRFADENFDVNRAAVERFAAAAADLDCTPGQLALAWVLAQGPDVVPIPGTRRRTHLKETAGAVDITLTPEQVQELADLLTGVVGARYARPHTYGDSPLPA